VPVIGYPFHTTNARRVREGQRLLILMGMSDDKYGPTRLLGLIGAVNMNEKETPAKSRAQFLRDAFEGMKGRQPIPDDELNQWLATDEGKAATIFDDTTLSPWGDRGRS